MKAAGWNVEETARLEISSEHQTWDTACDLVQITLLTKEASTECRGSCGQLAVRILCNRGQEAQDLKVRIQEGKPGGASTP